MGGVEGVWDLLWSSLTLEQKNGRMNEWKGVVISEVDLGVGGGVGGGGVGSSLELPDPGTKKRTNEWTNEKGVVISEVDLGVGGGWRGCGIFFGAV